MQKRYNVAMTEEMEKRLEVERKKRALDSIPETIRYILSEYLAKINRSLALEKGASSPLCQGRICRVIA